MQIVDDLADIAAVGLRERDDLLLFGVRLKVVSVLQFEQAAFSLSGIDINASRNGLVLRSHRNVGIRGIMSAGPGADDRSVLPFPLRSIQISLNLGKLLRSEYDKFFGHDSEPSGGRRRWSLLRYRRGTSFGVSESRWLPR